MYKGMQTLKDACLQILAVDTLRHGPGCLRETRRGEAKHQPVKRAALTHGFCGDVCGAVSEHMAVEAALTLRNGSLTRFGATQVVQSLTAEQLFSRQGDSNVVMFQDEMLENGHVYTDNCILSLFLVQFKAV